MKNSQKNNLWENIKVLRKKHNFTQKGLAKQANISYTTLTKIEIWVIKEPSVYTIAKIAKEFDVSVESLLN